MKAGKAKKEEKKGVPVSKEEKKGGSAKEEEKKVPIKQTSKEKLIEVSKACHVHPPRVHPQGGSRHATKTVPEKKNQRRA